MKKPTSRSLKFLLSLLSLSTFAAPTKKNLDKEKQYNSDTYKEHRQYNLSLDDRFETSLFASPPYTEYVTAVSADLDGTLYISQDPNGSLGHTKGVGNVITAKDTNGDGKADKFVEFIPTIESARGGHIVAGTYYLLHPPYLTSFKDTDGDGVADETKRLADGFGGGIEHPRGADHTTNGVRMGIDGWLYIAVGDFGIKDSKSADGKTLRFHGGGVARIRPDGSEHEMYVYNTRNQFDVAISPSLELFTRDNTNDGKGWNLRIHHQVPESDFGYPKLYQNFPDEHIASLADYGGGSGMGGLFLSEPGFPKDLNNKLYTCDWTTGKIFNFDLENHDATYKATQKIFTSLTRATDIDVDGQSTLYLSDWQGGGFKYSGDAKPVSRIHVAKLKGYTAPNMPNLKAATDNELINHLTGPSAAIRLQAQQYLLQKPLSSTSLQELESSVTNTANDLHGRIAALFTLKQGLGEDSQNFITSQLKDASIREFALKALTDRKDQMNSLSPDLIAPYLNDSNPKVRLQAAISLKRLNKFTEKSTNQLIDMAVVSWKKDSVGKLGTMALPHIASRTLAGLGQSHNAAWKLYLKRFRSSDLKTQKALSYGLKTIHNPQLIHELINDLALEKWSDDSRLIILDILARLSHKEAEWNLSDWWGTRPTDHGPYYKSVEWEQTNAIITAIEKNFSKFSSAKQIEVLNLISLNQIDTSKLKLEGMDTLFLALEARAPNKSHINTLKNTALDTKRPWEVRLKAGQKLNQFQIWNDPSATRVKKIGKGKKTKRVKTTDPKKIKAAQAVRLVSVKAFLEVLSNWQATLPNFTGTLDNKKIITALLHDYWTAPATHKADFAPLAEIANQINDKAATLAWKKILFAYYRITGDRVMDNVQIIDGEIGLHNPGFYQAVADLYLLDDKFKKRAEANLNWDYEGTRKAAKAVLDMHKAYSLLSQSAKQATPLTSVGLEGAAKYALENKGDLSLGEKLFNKQGCITCHAVNNAAIQKGPYMGTAGSQFERKFLIESILNPAAAIAQGFPTYQMTAKKSPAPHIGFLIDEDNTYYTLMNIAGLTEKVTKEYVQKKEILHMSQMPPGLVISLSLHEFTSLIDYLDSMK